MRGGIPGLEGGGVKIVRLVGVEGLGACERGDTWAGGGGGSKDSKIGRSGGPGGV